METRPNKKEVESEKATRPRYDFEVSQEQRVTERPSSCRIAVVQFPAQDDKSDNLQKAVTLAWQAADDGADIIAFPEMFLLPWVFAEEDAENFAYLANRTDDGFWTPLRTVARDKQVVLLCPFFEHGVEERRYNSCMVIDANGEIVGRYRKRHLPPDNERLHFMPGDGPFTTFPTAFGRIGIYICWDNFFPEGARALALDGADIVFAPTAATDENAAYKWELAIAGNALANGIPWVRVNRIGEDFYPANFVALPDGQIMPLDSEPGYTIVDIDYTFSDRVRAEWTFMQDRRPELYGDLID